MVDKITESLVDALRLARMQATEQRLYKSGKLDGLFSARHGASGDAATIALKEGLLEVVRTEVKGKTTVEWARLTPRGVNFLHEHESPKLVLQELQQILQGSSNALPTWLAQMQQELNFLSTKLADHVQTWTHRLEALSQRVEEALRRTEMGKSHLSNGMATMVPWALDALAYLDRRHGQGVAGECSLPELFAALRQRHKDLSVNDFHQGLRLLFDRRALHLLPFAGPATELPEPEFAFLDGPAILYYASR